MRNYPIFASQNKFLGPFHDRDGTLIQLGDFIYHTNEKRGMEELQVIGLRIQVDIDSKDKELVIVKRHLKVRNLRTGRIYTVSKPENLILLPYIH